jgi:hypothetical protein
MSAVCVIVAMIAVGGCGAGGRGASGDTDSADTVAPLRVAGSAGAVDLCAVVGDALVDEVTDHLGPNIRGNGGIHLTTCNVTAGPYRRLDLKVWRDPEAKRGAVADRACRGAMATEAAIDKDLSAWAPGAGDGPVKLGDVTEIRMKQVQDSPRPGDTAIRMQVVACRSGDLLSMYHTGVNLTPQQAGQRLAAVGGRILGAIDPV